MMYRPSSFAEDRVHVLHELIRRHPLATLVVGDPHAASEPKFVVEHIPMAIAGEGELGMLRAHVARANPVWRLLAAAESCMAVFQGPSGYVSPSWYPSKQDHGKVVPTWNYIVVHVSGRPRVIEDTAWLRQQVGTLTEVHEAARLASAATTVARAWHVEDAPADFVAGQLRAIVGLELSIERILGKY